MRISKKWSVISIITAILVAIASILGIFNPLTYSKETANWALQAVGQDIGNLLAIPALVISTFFLTKNSVKAFSIWLGTFLYFIYAYMVYAFFVHFNYLFLVYVAVLGLSFYTIIGGMLEQNLQNLTKALSVKKTKPASILLILIGALFGFLWISELAPALLSGEIPQSLVTAGLWVNPIHVIDLAFVLPGMILTGIFLLKKNPIGFLFAPALVTFSVLMGSSIVANMVLELSKGNMSAIVPFIIVGIIVIVSMVVLILHLRQVD